MPGFRKKLQQPSQTSSLGHLHLLTELSREFARSLDIEKTLFDVVSRVAEAMSAEAASVFLYDRQKSCLVCRACHGPVDIIGLEVPANKGVIGRTVQDNRVQLVKNTGKDPDFEGNVDKKSGYATHSLISAPLSTAEGVIGVIQVLNPLEDGGFDEKDCEILQILASPAALAIDHARMTSALLEQEQMRKELHIARQIQRSLLPKREKAPFPVLAINKPARDISGDFYDYYRLDDGRIAFSLGDVSGKGIEASLLMVRAMTLLRSIGRQGLPVPEWMSQVNQALCENISMGMFVCVISGYYDPSNGELAWVNAGLPPLLVEDHRGVFEAYVAKEPPLGILPGMAYSCESTVLDNAFAYIYSDGITESRDASGEVIGEEGFKKLISARPLESPERRLSHIAMEMRHFRISDDTTLMLIHDRCRWQVPMLEFGFTADADNLKTMRDAMQDALQAIGADSEYIRNMQLAVNEACTNVLRHAYCGDINGRLLLSLMRGENFLEFHLRDFAETDACECVKPVDHETLKPGGLGVQLIDTLMDEWFYSRPTDGKGNILIMRKEYGKE